MVIIKNNVNSLRVLWRLHMQGVSAFEPTK